MRLIFLDTETTGLNRRHNGGQVNDGHRIIEIACVEMIDGVLSGRNIHAYLNPGMCIDKKATKVHGINDEFLIGKKKFEDVSDELFEFLKGSTIVMHNADFDIAFIDGEIRRLRVKPNCIFSYIDSLRIARELYPGMDNTLKGLAERFNCDTTGLHGALKDATLLAEVFGHLGVTL